jgi:serine/threonine protein kinase
MAKNEISIIGKGFLFKSDKYEVIRRIGDGGFGIVYLVKDKHDDDEERFIQLIKYPNSLFK